MNDDSLEEASRTSRRQVLRGAVASGAALLTSKLASASTEIASDASQIDVNPGLREYWIQVNSFEHNLVPSGIDDMTGDLYRVEETTYWALGYQACAPGWQYVLPGNDDIGPNEGIPGPIIRARVGQRVRIHFRNNDLHYRFPHSIHVHGLNYAPSSDGAFKGDYADSGALVMPGESFTYEYTAVRSSVGTWVYHDHSEGQTLTGRDPQMELNAQLGMFGIIAVTDSTTPAADREICLFFHDYFADNIPELAQDFDAFNGRCFLSNTPTFEAQVGDRVRWRIATLGNEPHVFHLHGHRWLFGGQYEDTRFIGPAAGATIDYIEDNPGDWLYHCHIVEHMMGGMAGFYSVVR